MLKTLGLAQFAKSMWKPFESEFGVLLGELQRQNEDVKEELLLASEQAADQERRLEAIEREAANKYRKQGMLFRDKVDKTNGETRAWRLQVDERRSSKQPNIETPN